MESKQTMNDSRL